MTYIFELARHAPKNNDPRAHGTGVEALLDPKQIHKSITFAADRLSYAKELDAFLINIISTPVDRAESTAKLVKSVFDLDPESILNCSRSINTLIGSYEYFGSTDGLKVINLSPPAMSKIWGDAKKDDVYFKECSKEDKPLYAWCGVGFDNTHNKTGISLREIACRIGWFVNYKIRENADETLKIYDLGISHSGDIEPFLYLTLAMNEGKDGTEPGIMKEMFHRTGGGLNALESIKIESEYGRTVLTYPTLGYSLTIDRDIFRKQAEWYEKFGISEQIVVKRKSG